MSNPNFDTLVATTLKNYRANLADNITAHQVVWYQLKERGFVREDEGGTSIVEPLLIGRNTTVKSYAGYDVIDTAPQTGISAAEYNWKQVAGSVSISGEEEFKNSGSKTKVISLLQSKITQLELSMMLEINRQLQADGTGNGGKDITGLAIAVEINPSSTYGGINSSSFSYWKNQWLSSAATISIAAPTAGVNTMLNEWVRIYNSCMRGKVRPTVIITDQLVYEEYERSMQATTSNYRVMIDSKMADAGFMNLLFKETPVVFDEDMPGATLLVSNVHQVLFLNADFMKFVIGKGKNFVVTDMQRPENQDAKVSQVILYGNLTLSNRARQGRISNITINA